MLCSSEDSLFWRFLIPKVRYFESSLFWVRYSEGSLIRKWRRGPLFWWKGVGLFRRFVNPKKVVRYSESSLIRKWKRGPLFRSFVDPTMKRGPHSEGSLIRKWKGVGYSEGSLIRKWKRGPLFRKLRWSDNWKRGRIFWRFINPKMEKGSVIPKVR